MSQENKSKAKKIWTILTVFFAVIAAGCIIWIVIYLIQTHNAQKKLDELKESYVQETIVEESENVTQPTVEEEVQVQEEISEEREPEQIEEPDPLAEYNVPEKDIDWTALSEENADIYAWITVPGTLIDYPVLQHPEQLDYYLNHNMDGSSGYPGCIYTQMLNSKEWDDPQTVLYGHNMKNGTMFNTLHYYEDSVFFEENPYVYIYDEEKVRVYQIFAAYEFTSAHLLLSFDTKNKETFSAYLGGIFQRDGLSDNINRELEVTEEDKIITLSTCINSKPDNRYLVQAVLVAEGTIE